MDEAERCHRLAFILYGDLLFHGTGPEVIEQSNLMTWEVTGPDLIRLANQLHSCPGVRQAVAFGNTLHVSGDDGEALEASIDPFKKHPYTWRRIPSGLEDVFIHHMERSIKNPSS
jgi:ABC-2 type transport system ATP-binding protein